MTAQENDVNKTMTSSNTKYPYSEAMGSVLYLSNKCRADLSYARNYCSRKMENPIDKDIVNIKSVSLFSRHKR